MKHTLFFIKTLAVVMFFTMYKQPHQYQLPGTKKTHHLHFNNTRDTVKKINISVNDLASKKDPVCGMSVMRNFKDTSVFNSGVYAFCSKYCKETFIQRPDSYIKKPTHKNNKK